MRYHPEAVNALAMAAALDAYRYLVLECSQEEAWRRIKLMREADRLARGKEGGM